MGSLHVDLYRCNRIYDEPTLLDLDLVDLDLLPQHTCLIAEGYESGFWLCLCFHTKTFREYCKYYKVLIQLNWKFQNKCDYIDFSQLPGKRFTDEVRSSKVTRSTPVPERSEWKQTHDRDWEIKNLYRLILQAMMSGKCVTGFTPSSSSKSRSDNWTTIP